MRESNVESSKLDHMASRGTDNMSVRRRKTKKCRGKLIQNVDTTHQSCSKLYSVENGELQECLVGNSQAHSTNGMEIFPATAVGLEAWDGSSCDSVGTGATSNTWEQVGQISPCDGHGVGRDARI